VTLRLAPSQLDAIERGYCFAAWPQTYAHASWLDVLDDAVGLRVSRACGRTAGVAEQAVAQALLKEVGASASERVALDRVPLWAMQTHAYMRKHLSTVAALSVVPALKLAVSGAEARHWDAILGSDVRQAAMLLSHSNPEVLPPPQAAGFRQLASSAAKTADEWERFCLSLGLTVLASHHPTVCARVRLAWPRALRHVEPLATVQVVRSWLNRACTRAAQLLRADPPSRELVV
jgi:hypothetical protein